MSHVNDHLISLSSDSDGSDSSPFARTETPTRSDSILSIISCTAPDIINVLVEFESKRISSNSLKRETSSGESSFKAFLSDEGYIGDHVSNPMFAPSVATEISPLPVLAPS